LSEPHPARGPAPASRPGRAIEVDKFCESCGYNLRGQTARNCPECGRPFAAAAAAAGPGRIPWERPPSPGGAGRLRAYWATVELATFRPALLADEIDRGVSQSSARQFRRVTLALGMPTAVAVVGWVWQSRGLRPSGSGWTPAVLWWAAVVLASALLLHLATAVHWFFPRDSLSAEGTGRARALARYACAPLGFTPLAWLAAAPFFWANGWDLPTSDIPPPVGWLFYLWLLVTLLQWAAVWRTTFRLAEGASHGSGGKSDPVATGLFVLFLWAGLAVVILIAPPIARDWLLASFSRR
jgi:hypothetical protein